AGIPHGKLDHVSSSPLALASAVNACGSPGRRSILHYHDAKGRLAGASALRARLLLVGFRIVANPGFLGSGGVTRRLRRLVGFRGRRGVVLRRIGRMLLATV